MSEELIEACAERLVSNSWDIYIGEPNKRNWQDIANTILQDGRVVANAYLAACDHKFVFLRSAKRTGNAGHYNTHFIRVDAFFCERCLECKEIRKEDFARETPDWYLG